MRFQTIPLSAPPMGVGNGSNGPLASVWCLVGTVLARSPFISVRHAAPPSTWEESSHPWFSLPPELNRECDRAW